MAEPVLALDGIETCYGLSQVLFGSDHPYVTDEVNMSDLMRSNLPTREMNAILYENAQRLVPQLKA